METASPLREAGMGSLPKSGRVIAWAGHGGRPRNLVRPWRDRWAARGAAHARARRADAERHATQAGRAAAGVGHAGRMEGALRTRRGLGDPRVWALHPRGARSEEHTSELQSLAYLVCRLLLEK